MAMAGIARNESNRAASEEALILTKFGELLLDQCCVGDGPSQERPLEHAALERELRNPNKSGL